jgi:hypothetical protein
VASALLIAATPSAAQEGLDDPGSSMQSLSPIDGFDPGQINLEDACGKQIGCIILANNSDTYDLIEVDVDVKTRIERGPHWTNLMNDGAYIRPRKVFMIPRIGDEKFAVVGLRAVLRDPSTHDRQTIELGTIDLRPDPQKRLFVNFLRFAPPGGATAPAPAKQAPPPSQGG